MTKEEILLDIRAIEQKLSALKSEKQQTAIDAITDRLKSSADQMQHDQRSAAYVEFKKSESYILEVGASIEASGVIATDSLGNSYAIQWLDSDQTTARTFGNFKAGTTVTISTQTYIVSDFQHSFAGSTLTLLSLPQKAFIDGEAQSPYAGRNCRFNHSEKTLILSNRDRLNKDHVVILGNTKYVPAHIIGSNRHYIKYALESV